MSQKSKVIPDPASRLLKEETKELEDFEYEF
jgi:hypothetical protein